MDEVYIRTEDLAPWVAREYFNNKDFITLDEFYRAFEELSADYDRLKEDYEVTKSASIGYDEHDDYC